MSTDHHAELNALFSAALEHLKHEGVLTVEQSVSLKFERTRNPEHGDLATNVALTLAKPAKKNPRELAALIVEALPKSALITQVDIAGPGFINLFLSQDAKFQTLTRVLTEKEAYGTQAPNSEQKIMVEFVSANPTGPLHVGHGRGAVYGDSLARLLEAAGHTVEREYYVNDAGRQMDIIAASVWVRYAQAAGAPLELPQNGYQGEYIGEFAAELYAQHGDAYLLAADLITSAQAGLELEPAMDALIQTLKDELSPTGFRVFFEHALNAILADLKDDLEGFGVRFNTWFSERTLFDSGKIDRAIEKLRASGDVYEKDGALWFKTTAYGDEKDRVVVRENGQSTYFASDIAYHADKLERGFDLTINIWGADHHGYIARVKAALTALGFDADKLKILLVQFAVLYRSGEKIPMSTRSGQYVTLRALREEIGRDATRFFYTQRKSEQHMDFDLDLAVSKSNENPLYYVQYAHARISRLLATAAERGIDDGAPLDADFSQLSGEHVDALLKTLERFPEMITSAAKQFEPHQITYYLRDLATEFHSWYNSSRFLELEAEQRAPTVALCIAVQQVLKNGLHLIGVDAPDSM